MYMYMSMYVYVYVYVYVCLLFSKVIALVYLPYKVTICRTFEFFLPCLGWT